MSTILSAARGTPFKSWPGLFDLYRDEAGVVRAELASEMASRSLRLEWKISPEEKALTMGLLLIAATDERPPQLFTPIVRPSLPQFTVPLGGFDPGTLLATALALGDRVGWLALILKPLHEALHDSLRKLVAVDSPANVRSRAKRKLLRQFSAALDALEVQGKAKPHKRTASVTFAAQDGEQREMPLAWAVIEFTRQLVEEKHALPAKREVRERIEARFPDAANLSAPQWTASFREAGLANLPRAKNW